MEIDKYNTVNSNHIIYEHINNHGFDTPNSNNLSSLTDFELSNIINLNNIDAEKYINELIYRIEYLTYSLDICHNIDLASGLNCSINNIDIFTDQQIRALLRCNVNNNPLSNELLYIIINLLEKRNTGESLFCLGFIYDLRPNFPKDEGKAIKYYEKAIEKDFISALTNLGVIYSKRRKSIDKQKAFEYYMRASDKGCIKGLYNLGMMYIVGLFVKKSPKLAIMYFNKAAKAGDIDSLYLIGYIYESKYDKIMMKNIKQNIEQNTDQKLKQNIDNSLYYYHLASKFGHCNSLYQIGKIYETGKVVAKDIQKAIYYYKLAIENGKRQHDECSLAIQSLEKIYNNTKIL